jgi:hypothetical protein
MGLPREVGNFCYEAARYFGWRVFVLSDMRSVANPVSPGVL